METPLCIRLPRPPDLDAPAEHQPTGSEKERATNPQRLHPDSTHKQRQGQAHEERHDGRDSQPEAGGD